MDTQGGMPFGCNTLFDWLAKLETVEDSSAFIIDTLNAVIASENRYLWKTDDPSAMAAVLSAATMELIERYPKDVKSLISDNSSPPNHHMILKAIAVLEKMISKSESLDPWMKNAYGILKQLIIKKNALFQEEKAEKICHLALLHQLIQLHAHDPQDHIKKQIREKIAILDDVNKPCRETDYELPLCLTAKYGLVEETKLLLDHGANPNVYIGFTGRPLIQACMNGQVGTANLLIDAGAELFEEVLIDGNTGRTVNIALDTVVIAPKLFRYSPALYCAARTGNPEIVDYLISLGADLNQPDLNGETLLHKACESGNAPVAEYLIKRGLDNNKTTPINNESPLHYAVRANQLETAKLLLEHGADPNIEEKWWIYSFLLTRTALDIVKDRPHSEMFRLLRCYGALLSEEKKNSE